MLGPTGRVALVVRSVCAPGNARESAVFLATPDGGDPELLSLPGEFADGPRWSPDGSRLAYSAADALGSPRALRLVGAATAARRRVAPDVGDARAPAWSPAGDRLCFVAGVPVDDVSVAAEADWYSAHPHAARTAPLVRMTSLRARADGAGYRTQSAQLFTVGIEPGAAAVRLTRAEAFDDTDPAWSPDGRRVAFISSRSDDRRADRERNVWVVDVASGALHQLTFDAWLWGPLTWSPDGTHIACFGMTALRVPLSIRLWVIAADGSGAIPASEGLGAHIWPHGAPQWTADGARVIAAGGLGNVGALIAYDRCRRERSVLLEADAVFGLLQLLPDGQSFIGAATTPRAPSALVRGRLGGGGLTTVYDANAWLDGIDIAAVEPVRFAAADGLEISGWLVRPAAEDAAPPPCVLDVHYGPNAAWGPAFAFGAQVLAGRGIATLLLNPRGSTGYGDAFAAAADFGDRDFADLMTGLDSLVARRMIDGERLGIMGLSFGGFMASWAIAHTDRFRAAVSTNGISNQLSWQFTSDTGSFFYREAFGDPFASAANFMRTWNRSPLAHSPRIETPLLLLQSEADLRCPIDQGEELFGALAARGKTVELVRFPNAAHDLNGSAAPLHAVLAHALVLEWFERFMAG